jgi:tripartite ATP-independent transporter DctM subunit
MAPLVLIIVLLAFLGAPMFACLLALAILGEQTIVQSTDQSLYQHFSGAVEHMQSLITSSDVGPSLATIPLFTFMGYVLAESKTADRLVACAKAVLGWLPGGLAVATVFICAVFTTFTGASGVTIIAVGGLLLPALVKEGYKDRFALGLITGTGSIGLLFPPALPLVMYGIVYGITAQARAGASKIIDFRLEKFLLAGILPGLVLCGAVAIYAMYRGHKDKVARERFDARVAVRTTLVALPELVLPALMIVLLATGFGPEEAASLGALYVLLLEGVIYRDIKLRTVPRIFRETIRLVGAIFLVIFAATAMTQYFTDAHIPDRLFDWINERIHDKWLFLLVLNIFLLAVGSLMDIFSALVVVVPLIATAASGYGVDPYHLGVIFLLNLELGYVHPPIGLNLFISSHRFRRPMGELYWAILPYVVVMFGVLILVTYFPSLTPIHSETPETAAKPAVAEETTPKPSVTITWADGKTWNADVCKKVADATDKSFCESMFRDYAACDGQPDADRAACRKKALDSFLSDVDAKDETEVELEEPDGGTAQAP